MIPIRDINRSQTFPLVNYILIALNVLAFIWQMSLGARLEKIFFLYGLVPLRYSDPAVATNFSTLEQLLPFLTSIFLHGGIFHLLGNMWSLYLFGDNVEDRLGHLRYLVFYLLCGLAAGLTHLFTNWRSPLPTIGASGAISGVMGAYLVLFPGARILTLLPIFFFIQLVEVPAFVFLGLWFLMQILSAGAGSGQAGGVAWWAHIGGFVVGIALLKFSQLLPPIALERPLQSHTLRKRTPRLQRLGGFEPLESLDIRGWITVSPKEAVSGTRKLISVKYGLMQKNFLVTIPPGTRDGTVLRLGGLGLRNDRGDVGDLYLHVKVVPEGLS
ncbi:MAG: rhomboid family intramembrane serine protease [bacterium]